MKQLDVVQKYFDILFLQEDLNELKTIFAKDLKFTGPFFQFNSADEYINSLLSDPPIGFGYEVIEIFEKENKISVFYQFTKDDISTPMAQLFELKDNLIQKILLLFNSADFH